MLAKDLDAFFRELYLPAYAVALRILGDRYDAEDAAAEALARATSAWWRIGGVEYQRAWVLRVTANVAVDALRRRRPRGTMPELEGPRPVSDDRMILADALRRLPRRQREVLVLRYLADMTETQVADHLRISQGAVKQHHRRGLDTLRAVLDHREKGVSFAF